jgi:hypothetical protein
MIINQSVGFTFIHIPKSAGTSVTRFLAPLNGPFDLEIGGTEFGEEIQRAYAQRHGLRKHSTLSEAQRAIGTARPPGEMLLFTFVRNPYARLSSIFSFLRTWEGYNPELLRIMKSFPDFREFVASGLFTRLPGPDGMFRPQSDWLKLDGAVADSVRWFRIEEVETAIEAIRDELALRGADISLLPDRFPHANRSGSPDPAGLGLAPEHLARIDAYYAEDFRTFGYPTADTGQ